MFEVEKPTFCCVCISLSKALKIILRKCTPCWSLGLTCVFKAWILFRNNIKTFRQPIWQQWWCYLSWPSWAFILTHSLLGHNPPSSPFFQGSDRLAWCKHAAFNAWLSEALSFVWTTAVLCWLTLNRLDWVLRSAARLIGRLPRFYCVTAYMHNVLHWLTICQRIQYRIPARDSRCVLQRQRVSLYRYVSFAASMSVILLRGVSYYHSFSYYANKNKNGIFGYWSISKDWPPLWAAFLVDSQLLQILPFYISLHFTSFYFCRWLWAVLKRCYTCI